MISMKLWQRCGWWVALGAIAVGCSAEPPPPPLRVGTNSWPGYEPLYLARSLDYYPDGTVQLINLPSTTEVTRAYRNGDLDVVAVTLDELLQLANTRPGMRAILVTNISAGGDAILGRAPATGLQDLRGKRIGVEASALGAYFLTRALQLADLAVSDVQVVPLSIAEQESAFRSGSIDAVVTFDPVRSKLLQAGAVSLFDSRQLPGEIVDVLAVDGALLTERRADLEGLLQGWFKAVDYLKQRPNEATNLMAPRLGLSPEDLRQSYQLIDIPLASESYSLLDPRGDRSLALTLGRLGRLMVARQLLPVMPTDPTTLLDPQALPADARDRATD